ncbi:MAG: GGDEF domain-containing protein [Thioalkalispiraceae bacterium]
MSKKDKNVSSGIFESSLLDKLSVDELTLLSDNKVKYERFVKNNPDNAHTLLLLSLTNEEFREDDAKKHWGNIQEHRENLNNKLNRDVGVAVAALDYMTNINDILTDPILMEEDKSQNMTEFATSDLLTGLATRDIFGVVLKKEISHAQRTNRKISLALIDIDDFKKVNDQYGHQQGDNILSAVGKVITNNVRSMDTAARYGGEELVILMPDTSAAEAKEVAGRIRSDIEALNPEGIHLTVSIGIAESSNNNGNGEGIIKRADDALYKAKAAGKNRVICAD